MVTGPKHIDLLQKAHELTTSAGCYLMRDKKGNCLYVGKAKNLRQRVSSYFNQTPHSVKTDYLISHIVDFEVVPTHNEVEAFVLENRLIKQWSPKYNIQLKDDKTYPFLYINLLEPFPRLSLIRKPKAVHPDHVVIGPFAGSVPLKELITLLQKALCLRDCSLSEFKRRKTPCLLYQMHQCSGPCVGYEEEASYRKRSQMVISFFQGHPEELFSFFKEKIEKLTEDLEFHEAIFFRDGLFRLKTFIDNSYDQHIEGVRVVSCDLITLLKTPQYHLISLLFIREGLWLGQRVFKIPTDLDESPLFSALVSYYSKHEIPSFISLDWEEEERSLLQEAILALSEVARPDLFKVVGEIASLSRLKETAIKELLKKEQEEQRDHVAQEMQQLFSLPYPPELLECYDVAIWQGLSPTASRIVCSGGHLMKEAFRYYKLATRPEGNNDVAMMREVLLRRFENKLDPWPDLIILDGGKGQLRAVVALLEELSIPSPVIALAKEKNHLGTEERVFIRGRKNPIFLKKHPQVMKLLCTMRDEAHRFSRKLHHHLESQRVLGEES